MDAGENRRRHNGTRSSAPIVTRRLALAASFAALLSLRAGRPLADEPLVQAQASDFAGTYTAVYTTLGGQSTIEFAQSVPQALTGLDAHVYDPTLSYMLAAVSTAAYSGDCIVRTLRGLGFDDAEARYYYDDPNDERYPDDAVAYGIGRATGVQGGTVYLVAARGSYGAPNLIRPDRSSSDWRSNYNAGDANGDGGGVHRGFDLAAERLYEELLDYAGAPFGEDARFVVCGHSRGAAVANLLAVKLIDRGVSQENVYCYTIACPDVARLVWEPVGFADSYAGIFNINNAADPITYSSSVLETPSDAPSEGDLSWGKYGNSYWFSLDWSDRARVLPDFTYAAHLQPVYLGYLEGLPDIGEMRDFPQTLAAMQEVRDRSSIRARLGGFVSSLIDRGE